LYDKDVIYIHISAYIKPSVDKLPKVPTAPSYDLGSY